MHVCALLVNSTACLRGALFSADVSDHGFPQLILYISSNAI